MFALLLLGAGCERAELAKEMDAPVATDTGAGKYRISRDEAFGALQEMIRCVDGAGTRGERGNRLAGMGAGNLCAVGGMKTRGGELPDTLLYYLNLAGGNGYAILPADRRLGELPLVVTEGGSITAEYFEELEEDFLPSQDTGLPPTDATLDSGYVVDNVDGDINRDVARLAMRYACSIHKPLPFKIDDGTQDEECKVSYSYGPWEWRQKVGPHLSTKWHQGSPFNDWCPIKTNKKGGESKRAPAGCVTIAVAQILAYHGWPNNKEWWDVQVNWDTLRTVCNWTNKTHKGSAAAQQQAAALAREVGIWLKVSYGYDRSGATDFMARWYLKHLGYSRVNRHCGIDESLVARLLNDGRIVYASSSTHAWLIDGYIEPMRTNTRTRVCPYDTTQRSYWERGHIRVHCNFGWNGASDGYYFPGIFNTTAGPAKKDPVDRTTASPRTRGDYSYNIHTITYW